METEPQNVHDSFCRPTVSQINERNQRFWRRQSKLRDRRILDKAVRESAIANLHSEECRGVPVKNRKTFELALADAEKEQTRFKKKDLVNMGRARFHSEFSRKGGRAPKKDALGRLIDGLVQTSPKITKIQLLHKLRHLVSEGDVRFSTETDDVERIYVCDADGREKTAPVTGLKDRLSRAKQKINSR